MAKRISQVSNELLAKGLEAAAKAAEGWTAEDGECSHHWWKNGKTPLERGIEYTGGIDTVPPAGFG